MKRLTRTMRKIIPFSPSSALREERTFSFMAALAGILDLICDKLFYLEMIIDNISAPLFLDI